MRISDWSSDVCSSDLERADEVFRADPEPAELRQDPHLDRQPGAHPLLVLRRDQEAGNHQLPDVQAGTRRAVLCAHFRSDQGLRVPVRQVQAHEVSRHRLRRSEEHTSELQSLMRISYAVFCLKKKKQEQKKLNDDTQ